MSLDAPPIVLIGGTRVMPDWDSFQATAMSGLKITWGRTDLYEDAKPAQISLTVIDPTGEWIRGATLEGAVIEIRRADGRTLFRGSITAFDYRMQSIQHPETGESIKGWSVPISASDVLADMAQAVVPGPGNLPGNVANYGPNYWVTQSPAARIKDIMDTGGWQFVDGIEWVDPYPIGGYWPLTRYRKFADQQSILTMITMLYYTHPLAVPKYNPDTHRIELGKPAASTGVKLSYAGGVLSLSVPGGHSIPAKSVIVPSGYVATTGIDKSIGSVQIVVPQLGPSTGYEIVDTATEARTSYAAMSGNQRRQFKRENDTFYNAPNANGSDWQRLLAEDTRTAIDSLNGMIDLPKLRFDTHVFAYGAALLDAIINTYSQPTPIFFQGSVFSPLPGSAPNYQIIGGTLEYANGRWTHDVTTATTVGSLNGVSIGALVTNPDASYADFDPAITLADLGHVTQGAA